MEVSIVMICLSHLPKWIEEAVLLHFPKSVCPKTFSWQGATLYVLVRWKRAPLEYFYLFSVWFMYTAFKDSLRALYEGEICHFHSCFQECRMSRMVNTVKGSLYPHGVWQYRLSHFQCSAQNTEKEYLLAFWCLPRDASARKWLQWGNALEDVHNISVTLLC